jgi:hypothetical protein
MRKKSRKGGRVGIRKVTVPNLSGLTRSQAQSLLSSLGLNYSESTTNTSTLSLTDSIASQGSAHSSTVSIGSTVPFVYYNYVDPVVYTYGPCEIYGDPITLGTGTQCSGDYYQEYTDYRYNTRKKIYADGVWNGLSYTTSGCGTSDSRVVTSSTQVNGQCGYVTPPVITYGPCEAYGSGTQIGSGTQCSGTYYQSYIDYRYNTRKKIYSDGVWDGSSYSTSGCSTTDSRTITSSSQVDGQCGYVAPCSITSYSGWDYSGITWSGNCVSSVEAGTATSRSRTDNCGNTYNESGSYSVSRSCTPPCSITSYSEWSYSGISWSGNCPSGTESGTASSRSRTDNCGNFYSESGSYSVTRSCTVVETYGPCEAYTFTQPVCNGEDSYVGNFTGYRKTSNLGNTTTAGCSGASFTGFGACIARNVSSCGGSGGSGSSCDAPPPVTNQWYCTTSVNGGGVGNCEYTMPGYDNSGSGSGFSRQCTYGTSYPACQSTNPPTTPVCTSYKYNCKSYDVTNSASNNYFQCYTVGECAANNNSDGSRTTCCASYA